ncbi:DUF1810 family protein [Jatrophihabitans sp. DSM 44399]|uniref:DUF1810 family protein n=1 Tax=Jatrophihabitans lederbergiae TaxID=3075547 RepID=A0ABU2JBS8_9ACTN|nr:DUF1810 family protein [Jatrophihabitans sp. DSM 44399]MDT0262119.1 DUF1810 family protein [Jatrophihabitans sp. DSM 44399]
MVRLSAVAGLGQSATSRRYAITSLGEARAYLAQSRARPAPAGVRDVVTASDASSAAQLLDGIDAHKLRSSMTLFLRAAPAKQVFAEVLDRFSDATADPATDALL